MGQDRRKYKYGRMLIEASRILDSQFDRIGLELTGAQVELLRNATILFHEQDVFVDTYHDGYYLNASDADYDDVLAVVADLERKLMGDENTIFAYNDRYFEQRITSSHAGGAQYMETTPVPVGYLYAIQQISMIQMETSGEPRVLRASVATGSVYLARWPNTVLSIPSILPAHLVLKETDRLRADWYGTNVDELLKMTVWGYMMKVPE